MPSDLTDRALAEANALATSAAAETSTLKSQAAEIARPAGEKLAEVAEAEKALGADKLRTLARAVHAAAHGLDSEMPGLASHVRRASAWIDESADHLRAQRFEEVCGSVENFARRNPALAFMAASVSGLALARFLKNAKKSSSN